MTVPFRASGGSDSHSRAAVPASASAGSSRTSAAMLSTASAGSPATMCSTAAFRSTERCRITSSIRAVAMPARCSRRNGWPAATERS